MTPSPPAKQVARKPGYANEYMDREEESRREAASRRLASEVCDSRVR
jgi:hypothetical protein